jgi:hypothetical protein
MATIEKPSNDSLAEQVEELDELRAEAVLAGRIREWLKDMTEVLQGASPSLHEIFAHLPEDIASRIARESRDNPSRAQQLRSTLKAAVKELPRLAGEHGIEGAVIYLMEFAIPGISRWPCDKDCHYDGRLFVQALFGDGRILYPWAVDLLADEKHRFQAALYLSVHSPTTPGLSEILLQALTYDAYPENVVLESAYPPNSRKYMPLRYLVPVRQALAKVPLSNGAAVSSSVDPIYCHAADFVTGSAPCPANLASQLLQALSHQDSIVRRIAALGLSYCPDELAPSSSDLMESLRHKDIYVQRMIALVLSKRGHIRVREVGLPEGGIRWDYYLAHGADVIQGAIG